MRGVILMICALTGVARAQEVVPPVAESARADSGSVTPVTPVLPPQPTPAQSRYLQGLRTVSRGIAQLKIGVSRVTDAGRDSARLHSAGQRLAAICGAASQFIAAGRPRMALTAYEDDSTRLKARKLSAQIDSLQRYLPTCQTAAVQRPDSTTLRLQAQLKAYDLSLRDFRAAIGMPMPARPN